MAFDTTELCQGKKCKQNDVHGKLAVKICHHHDCQEFNKGYPLLLCKDCDSAQHIGHSASHARFSVPGSKGRTPSVVSAGSDSGTEEDVDQNNKKSPHGYTSGKKMFKLSSAGNKKKTRRHNTDELGREFFTLKFHDVSSEEYETELVPALKGKSLRDSLEPLYQARQFSFETHSVFLAASNTPLPLAFDTFPLGGNVLHVRANTDVKVDQRVVNMVKQIGEDDKSKEKDKEPSPRPAHFIRTPSFSKIKTPPKTKLEEEKEKEKQKEQEHEKTVSQQLKSASSQKGKKNILSFLGEGDPSILNQSGNSPPVSTSGSPNLMRSRSTGTKASANKITGLFVPPKSRDLNIRSFQDMLDFYTVYGLDNVGDIDGDTFPEEAFDIEDSWTQVVDNADSLNKKQKDQQEAIWELLSTEVAYINKIKVLTKLFLRCLKNLQEKGFLQEIEGEKLFSNIEDIYEVNSAFWVDCLSAVVNKSRVNKKPLDPVLMADGFPMFGQRFEPYIQNVMDEPECLKYLKEKMQEDDNFKSYVEWCENHKQCNRLKMKDLLIKPMQRVTKYPLLLKAILKKTLDTDVREQLCMMIERVESFVSKVNMTMRIRHEKEKLEATIARIDMYAAVDPISDEIEKILVDYSTLDLNAQMPGSDPNHNRCVILEGPLKLVDKQSGKMEVHAFLFTDLLLLTKPKKGGEKYKIIKPPLRIDKIVTHPLKDSGSFLLIYLNEYHTVVHAFTLQGSAVDYNRWMDALKKARRLFADACSGADAKTMLSIDLSDIETFGLGMTPTQSPVTERRSFSMASNLSVDSDDESDNGASAIPVLTITEANSKTAGDTAGAEGKNKKTNGNFQRRNSMKREESRSACYEYTGSSDHAPKISRSSSAPDPNAAKTRAELISSLSRASSLPQSSTKPVSAVQRALESSRRRSLPMSPDDTECSPTPPESPRGEDWDTSSNASESASLSSDSFKRDDFLPRTLTITSSVSPSAPLPSPVSPSDIDTSVFYLASTPSPAPSPTPHATPSPVTCASIVAPSSPTSLSSSISSPTPSSSHPSSASPTTSSVNVVSSINTTPSFNVTITPGARAGSPTRQFPLIKTPLLSNQLDTAKFKSRLPRRSQPVAVNKPRLEEIRRRVSKDLTADEQKTNEGGTPVNSPPSTLRLKLMGANVTPSEGPKDKQSVKSPTETSKSTLIPSSNILRFSSLTNLTSVASSESDSDRVTSIPQAGALRRRSSLTNLAADLAKLKESLSALDSTKTGSSTSTKKSSPSSSNTNKTHEKNDAMMEKLNKYKLEHRRASPEPKTDIKEGIASGPNIDKRKATKMYLRDSLLLDSSLKANAHEKKAAAKDKWSMSNGKSKTAT